MWQKTESLEILSVDKVYDEKREREFLLKCPHCGHVRGIDKEDTLKGLGGEQYQDNLCNGWYEISRDAKLVTNIEEL